MKTMYLSLILLITMTPAAMATVYSCGACMAVSTSNGACVSTCTCTGTQTGCIGAIAAGDTGVDDLNTISTPNLDKAIECFAPIKTQL